MSPADDIRSEAGLFDRRIVSAVSTVVPKTTSVGSNPTTPVYLRSIMDECNGFLIRRLQVRVLSQIVWQRGRVGRLRLPAKELNGLSVPVVRIHPLSYHCPPTEGRGTYNKGRIA